MESTGRDDSDLLSTSVSPRARAEKIPLIAWLVGSLTQHRDLLSQMVLLDLRGRYVGSTLGLFWTVIHPLVMIAIYTLVFSRIMGSRLASVADPYAYGIYLCSALLPWMAFQEILSRSTTIFPDNANLVRKVAFPKVLLYGVVTISSAVNLGLALAVFFVAFLLTGHPPHATLLLWFPFLGLQLLFALGLGILASVLHVFVRDTAQMVAVLLQVWFWGTPVVYVETVLPAWLQRAEQFNPLYLFSATHHDVLLYGTLPSIRRTAVLALLTATILALGLGVYRRFRADVLDEL